MTFCPCFFACLPYTLAQGYISYYTLILKSSHLFHISIPKMLDEFPYDHHFTKYHKAFDIFRFSVRLQNKFVIHMVL
jgi:hypothetical protein